MKQFLPLLAALLLAFPWGQAAYAGEAAGQVVTRAGSAPSRVAGPENFSGHVRVDPALKSHAPARAYGAWVTFEPGSRTAWHIPPLGQTLVVTSGRGITQEWGKEPVILLPGDVLSCPPGVRHWHGAMPDTAMTHLAIGEQEEGKPTRWQDKLSDADYAAAAKAAKEAK